MNQLVFTTGAPFVFATGNQGKLKDARHFFSETDIKIISPEEAKVLKNLELSVPEVEETGLTYQENAELKVRALFNWCGLPSFADDSGIEVDALDGAPGLYSARYAGVGCSYDDNINKMLNALSELEQKNAVSRIAKFISVIAYTLDGKNVNFIQGEIKGRITTEPRGKGGFGYDPIFEVIEPEHLGCGKTLAELKLAKEAPDTHRTRAFKEFVKQLSVLS